MNDPTLIIFVLVFAALALMYKDMQLIFKVLRWIISNVHIVPNNKTGKEALSNVARALGVDIPKEDE